ncbi:hypothetical protein GCM10010404_49530 [Nonomuraea africana]|uniref:Uncharacterized protein n=1 Tax=Nonomuraea africana TaxID=46171 RepID=A0ABR9KVL9_9ACTN|nr:hypothetical protein [Nonomuraea africana]MBE1566079.1 hypothetical protein [Nonomuraea africana]
MAQEEHGGVVVQRAVDVRDEIEPERLERGLGVVRPEQGDAVGERIELPSPVAMGGLAEGPSTTAAVSTASRPLPWTSPTITLAPPGAVTTSYRSPPMRASATAEV